LGGNSTAIRLFHDQGIRAKAGGLNVTISPRAWHPVRPSELTTAAGELSAGGKPVPKSHFWLSQFTDYVEPNRGCGHKTVDQDISAVLGFALAHRAVRPPSCADQFGNCHLFVAAICCSASLFCSLGESPSRHQHEPARAAAASCAGEDKKMTSHTHYRIEGSYYEACNCQAICPCRRKDGMAGGLSTYGVCDFLLSWNIVKGEAGGVDLSGTRVCYAGSYGDDVEGKPWTVYIYIDDQASEAQALALGEIFQGHWGGDVFFTREIGELLGVRRASITLDHTPGKQRIVLKDIGGARVLRNVETGETISCGIPGHDHPGTETVSSLHLKDGPFDFSYDERCGFATEFCYSH
jgi:hypothetical protein